VGEPARRQHHAPILAVAVNLAAYPVRAWRWRNLLSPMKEPDRCTT